MTTSPLQVHLVHRKCACGRLEGEHMTRVRCGVTLQTGGTNDGHCSGYTPRWDVYSVRAYVDVPIGEAAPQMALQRVDEGSCPRCGSGRPRQRLVWLPEKPMQCTACGHLAFT